MFLSFSKFRWLFLLTCIRQVFAEAKEPNTQLFTNFTSTLATEQAMFFPNQWLQTNQWEGAFAGTMLSSSIRTMIVALQPYGSFPRSTNGDADRQTVRQYYAQVQQYYSLEPINVIYGEAYDDAQWVVLGWLEAIRPINEYNKIPNSTLGPIDISRFAHRSHLFYNRIQDKFDTSLCGGGLVWNPALAPYKNAITNELFISSSIGMYLYYPGDNDTSGIANVSSIPYLAKRDPILLSNAIKEYNWFMNQKFFNAQGLIIDGFHISENQTTCDQPDTMVYTYNQGVILSGMRQLWEATGDQKYLLDGYKLINAVLQATGWNNGGDSEWKGLGRNGILEEYCDTNSDGCNQDGRLFKGIYFHHLRLFCEPLPTASATIPGITVVAPADLAKSHSSNCRVYQEWTQQNAQAALSTRDAGDIIGGWWGQKAAAMQGKTQVAIDLPAGAVDYRRHPEILNNYPWKNNRGPRFLRRQSNMTLYQHTVETEISGLSVVKAAWDLTQV